MTDSIQINSNETFGVVTVLGPQGPAGPQGPQGASGPPGPFYEGVAWFYGEGEPGTIVGSKPGDFFFSTDTGVIYVLGGG